MLNSFCSDKSPEQGFSDRFQNIGINGWAVTQIYLQALSLQLGGSTGSPNTAEIWGEYSNILATYATCDDFYAMVNDQFSRVGLGPVM